MSWIISNHNWYSRHVWDTLYNILKEPNTIFLIDNIIHDIINTPIYFYDIEYDDDTGIVKYNKIISEKETDNMKIIIYDKENDKCLIVKILYNDKNNKTLKLKLYGTTNFTTVPSLADENIRKITYLIRNELEKDGIKTYDISYRDGFTIFMTETDKKRAIIWIRRTPITEKALNLFEKIKNKYEHDTIIIIRTNQRAEQVKVPYIIEYCNSIKQAVKIIKQKLLSKK